MAAVGRKRDSQATQTPVGHSLSTGIMFDNGWRGTCSKELGLPDGVNETQDSEISGMKLFFFFCYCLFCFFVACLPYTMCRMGLGYKVFVVCMKYSWKHIPIF